MIVFDLRCGARHVFEAWFGSTADFDAQGARGLISCPICGDATVTKAAMAPAVPAKGNHRRSPAEDKAMLGALAKMQAEIEASSDYVGPRFAVEARAIHDGDSLPRAIFGEATLHDAALMIADGIAVAPLPFRSRRNSDA